MQIKKLQLKTISPLNYYYAEAGRGVIPSIFLGDIALKYALLHQLGYHNFPEPGKNAPTYKEDLIQFKFWFTVAMPPFYSIGEGDNSPQFMKSIIRNTMQGIDYNGTNAHPKIVTGSIMYKNFYFQQYIKPGSIYYTIFISGEKMELPETLRLGTGKTGLIKINEVNDKDIKPYINLYTLKNILQNEKFYDEFSKREFSYIEHLLLQYYIVGPVSIDDIKFCYDGYV